MLVAVRGRRSLAIVGAGHKRFTYFFNSPPAAPCLATHHKRFIKTQLDAMESRLDAVDTTCEAGCEQAMRDLGFSGGSKKGAKKSDVEKAGAVAIAGLIAALVALAVAATACCRVNKLVSNRSSMEAAKDCVPTSGRKEPLAVQGDSYTPSTRRH